MGKDKGGKDIAPGKKSKPLTKKERKEQKKKRKQKRVSYEWMHILFLSIIIKQSMFLDEKKGNTDSQKYSITGINKFFFCFKCAIGASISKDFGEYYTGNQQDT